MRNVSTSVVAVALGCAWGIPAQAQETDRQSIARELAEMRAQMQAMASRIDSLESELAAANARADAASVAAAGATETALAAQAEALKPAAKPPVKIAWKGAPVIEGEGGWSFKIRGRVNVDAGFFDVPDSTGRDDGFGSEVRRARIGAEGTIPGGFGYKFEAGLGPDLAITDAFVTYTDKGLTLIVGHQNTFQSLEELTSSLHIPFTERAAFTDAFGFERRLGVGVTYASGPVLLEGGVFTDNYAALPNGNLSFDGRAVYAPKLGETQLHLGASVHRTELESGNSVRYRQRPFEHFTGERFVDTGSMAASGETGVGLEAAMIAGRLDLSGEAFWQTVSRPGLANPTFFGGYAQIGYFLTHGDRRGYKYGMFDRVRPANPVGAGGIGAVQVAARYDYLDLSDKGIVGGRQQAYQLALAWSQTDYTKLYLSYSRLQYRDAVHPAAGGDTSYGADALVMRAQVDF
ncbi:OprO/OprP family phosphate-selective porin [Novosphingobium aquimarinum]|uniref:OprO/OprP family phosphate-selective porin n=1 Tax=Novosphingobium aquimarinum TaxID=2682494 RepID=UPI0012EB7E14|nr:porin [Novosphingobium aquimarinum]